MIENKKVLDVGLDEEIADTVSGLKFSGDGESAYDMEEPSAPVQTM